MNDMLSAFFTSRKAWVLILCVVGVVVMNLTGRIDGAAALDFIQWVVSAWLGAVALEDGASKLIPRPAPSPEGQQPSQAPQNGP